MSSNICLSYDLVFYINFTHHTFRVLIILLRKFDNANDAVKSLRKTVHNVESNDAMEDSTLRLLDSSFTCLYQRETSKALSAQFREVREKQYIGLFRYAVLSLRYFIYERSLIQFWRPVVRDN